MRNKVNTLTSRVIMAVPRAFLGTNSAMCVTLYMEKYMCTNVKTGTLLTSSVFLIVHVVIDHESASLTLLEATTIYKIVH